jgi:hypothetical protein
MNIIRSIERRFEHHRTPSFVVKMAERRRIYELLQKNTSVDRGPIYEIETKLGQKEIARSADIAFAPVLQGPHRSFCNFDFDDMPEHFCIKPNWGHSGEGVLLLKKLGGGILEDIKTGTVYRVGSEIVDTKVLSGRSQGHAMFAEAMIFDENGRLPCDFKIYVFYGVAALVMQIQRHQGREVYKYYDVSGRSLGRIIRRDINEGLAAPKNLPALLDAAARVSRRIRTPFVRVDLYEIGGEPVFGEITLTPGGSQRFKSPWDRELGMHWEDACSRLIADVGDAYIF